MIYWFDVLRIGRLALHRGRLERKGEAPNVMKIMFGASPFLCHLQVFGIKEVDSRTWKGEPGEKCADYEICRKLRIVLLYSDSIILYNICRKS